MIPEQFMLEFCQRSLGDQAKIGDIFFVFSAPGRGAGPPHVRFERNAAQVPFLRHATHEAIITDPENTSENAIAGRQRAFSRQSQSRTMALRAGVFGERQRFRSSPFHNRVYPHFFEAV